VIVADASWIVALRDPEDEHHARAVTINEATATSKVLLHPVTLAECLVAPAKLGVLDEAAAALRAAYDIVVIDDDAPLRWAQLRARAGLRLPDAIVLDTALTHGVTAIATFDDRLIHAANDHGIATES
jgi:predicted nucleic acid-binding protein